MMAREQSYFRSLIWASHASIIARMSDAKFAEYCRTGDMGVLWDSALLIGLSDWCGTKAEE